MNKIAITGANGQLGRATLTFLLEQVKPSAIVAVVREKSKLADFSNTGIAIKEATYDEPDTLIEAFRGVDTLLHVSASTAGPIATKQEQHVVAAAKLQGIKKVVYTSTLHPQADAHFMATATCLQTEKAIRESGMQYVFFRNSMYMETIPLFLGNGFYDGQIYFPAGKGSVSFVSRLDIAKAIANVLQQTDSENAAYDITGDAAYTFDAIAQALGQIKNLKANYVSITDEVYEEELAKTGMPEAEIAFYLSMARSIRTGEFMYVDDSLEKLLGRKRKTLTDYLKTA